MFVCVLPIFGLVATRENTAQMRTHMGQCAYPDLSAFPFFVCLSVCTADVTQNGAEASFLWLDLGEIGCFYLLLPSVSSSHLYLFFAEWLSGLSYWWWWWWWGGSRDII